MCENNIKTLAKVTNGELSVCCECRVYHLEFNNIYLELNENEFEQFKNYLFDIEMDYWEYKYASAKVKRKIPIPSMQQNLVLMFKREEIVELRMLLSSRATHVFNEALTVRDIDYTLILN
ncbi:DUF6686 family protein [Algibacter miyuki]|uniref:DUF6686 family protein n=1 Tax=Algibacter miyuki TaxID=1306933 RepID=A0ABV5GV73_9FLAO|nr:DUF6686 family protein [Algibacter miyuki]MDN3664865.1 hypothetical protein [Algibacter miyuki]